MSLFTLQMQQTFLNRVLAVSLACGFAHFAVTAGYSKALWPAEAFQRVTLSVQYKDVSLWS